MRPMHGPPVLAMADLGDSRCGVGNAVACLLAVTGVEASVIDPTATWSQFRRQALARGRGADVAIVVYPTRSTVRRPRFLLRVAALRWWLRGTELRAYLHEYARLGRRHRRAVTIGLGLTSGRIVVCLPSEASAVRAALGGGLVRGRDVVAVPAPNGTAPDDAAVERAFAAGEEAGELRRRTVGVFGAHRPDKDPTWLDGVLRDLDPRFERLELVGSGWDAWSVPAELEERYEIYRLGHVPGTDLAKTMGRWGLAVAPFWEGGTHDGRGSLRTPLGHGVTTLTRPSVPGELTLDVPHLLFADGPGDATNIPDLGDDVRRAGAVAVAAFEADAISRTAEALFGAAP